MIDYREIIRLKNLKFSNVAIANSLCCSRNTVSEVLKLAGRAPVRPSHTGVEPKNRESRSVGAPRQARYPISVPTQTSSSAGAVPAASRNRCSENGRFIFSLLSSPCGMNIPAGKRTG